MQTPLSRPIGGNARWPQFTGSIRAVVRNGRHGSAGSLDEAKAAFRAEAGADEIMLNLSLSVDDPGCVKTLYFIMIGVVPAL